jgi:hypothetical protein
VTHTAHPRGTPPADHHTDWKADTMNTTTNSTIAAPAQRERTLREQWNERMGNDMVDQAFKAIKAVRRYTNVVTFIAMGVSYFHQRNFFFALGAAAFSWFLPLTLDCVMLALMKVGNLRIVKAANRRKARRMMIVPAVASMVVNALAHGHPVLRGFYAFVVIAILIGEYAESLIDPDFEEFEKEVAEKTGSAKKGRKLDPEVAKARAEKAAATRLANAETRKARAAKRAETRRMNEETKAAEAKTKANVETVQAALEIPGLDTVQALNGNTHRLHVVSRHTP